MSISRRLFLKGACTAGLTLACESVWPYLSFAENSAGAGQKPILVLIQLSGGNDGLNTVVPYNDGAYFSARASLALRGEQVLPLTGQVALNGHMPEMQKLYKSGQLAIVQAVGYAQPNRSHFRSTEIWQTAEPKKLAEVGWLGKYLDLAFAGNQKEIFPAVNVDPFLPLSLVARKINTPSIDDLKKFRFNADPSYRADRKTQLNTFNNIYETYQINDANSANAETLHLLKDAGINASKASARLNRLATNSSSGQYPVGKFGDNLRFIAQMIAGNLPAHVYTTSLDGFDTHTNQERVQTGLLKQLSKGLAAFQNDLEASGQAPRVITVVFSEFGRRVSENGARGTDHGTAQPVFIVGNKVKSGIYGDAPSLTNLDDGDLKHKIDFRCVYATVLDKWLQADSRQVLGQQYDVLPFV